MKKQLAIACAALLLAACGTKNTNDSTKPTGPDYTQVVIPQFSADTAYAIVAAQTAFGPRTPGSTAWQRCSEYLQQELNRWCDTVIAQPFKTTLWDGTNVPGTNIIGSINPQAERRVLIGAHWDSRLWADHDANPSKNHQPVPGANDGASGCAILIEMARAMHSMPPSVGVDFILFDVEDQGLPEWAETYDDNTWCKGSQHWARNRHQPYYTAVYGILLDMVGTTEPRFTKEQVSRHYAPGLTDKLWAAAAALGHSTIFVPQNTDPILDDHLYINQIAGIPTADIVQNSPTGSFFKHWHTTTDDLEAVSPSTLAIVAEVVMKTIYGDFPAQQ